jgi:protein-tyrosine phosphatase
MLRLSKAQGVDTVVLTPHFYGKRHNPAEFLLRRNASYQRLLARMQETQTQMNVRLGAEVHFTGINPIENDAMCSLAIEGTEYVLVEFPFTTVWTSSLTERISQFIYDTDYTPIIAHVERYREVQKKPSILSELVDMGCLLQVNTTSFLNKTEKKFAFALLKHGLVHCLGTDAHDAEYRAPDYAQAKQALEEAGYGADFERIHENMRLVLDNQRILPTEYRPLKKILGFYL